MDHASSLGDQDSGTRHQFLATTTAAAAGGLVLPRLVHASPVAAPNTGTPG